MKKLFIVISFLLFSGSVALAAERPNSDLLYDAGALFDHLKKNGDSLGAPIKTRPIGKVDVAFDAGVLLDHLRRTGTSNRNLFFVG
jgi:hypothetical protein